MENTARRGALFAPMPESLKFYRPDHKHFLLDESSVSGDELDKKSTRLVTQLLRLERAQEPEQVRQIIEDLIAQLHDPKYLTLRRAFAIWLGRVVLKRYTLSKILRMQQEPSNNSRPAAPLLLSLAFLVCLCTCVLTASVDLALQQSIDHIPTDWGIANCHLLPALLTVFIEVPLFFLAGYRKGKDCCYFACINLLTNLLLNHALELPAVAFCDTATLFLCSELLVVCTEFALCTLWIRQSYGKLLAVILLTNTASFLCGLLLALFY